MAGKWPPTPHEPYADCMFCKDTGLVYLPDFPPVYRFCGCWRGRKLQEENPNLADEANERERKLVRSVKA